MPAPLVKPIVMSIYEVNGQRVPMPERMARCTPDLKKALYGIREELEALGGKLALSDLFRSYDMQLQAHLDFVSRKKKAYSPAPGASMHESGRAFDVDLSSIKVGLPAFWQIASRHGVVPIIAEPNPKVSEAWHFECRGSHQLVYDHYRAGRGTNFSSPASAMAASAIVAAGQPHDRFKGRMEAAYIQSAMIRLGLDVGNIDGDIGPKTLDKLSQLGVASTDTTKGLQVVDALLQVQFPSEFFDRVGSDGSPFV